MRASTTVLPRSARSRPRPQAAACCGVYQSERGRLSTVSPWKIQAVSASTLRLRRDARGRWSRARRMRARRPSALAASMVRRTAIRIGACAGNHTPAVEINGGNEQQPGAERVEQQAGLERIGCPYTSGDHRRRHEVRPVVIERSALQIRVANRRVRLRELGGQRHVPQEVGGEIGPVSQVARRIPLSDPRERPCNEQRYDEEGAKEASSVAAVPLRKDDDSLTASGYEVRRGRQCCPRGRSPCVSGESEVDRDPQDDRGQPVADECARNPAGSVSAAEQ